jgi:two-component system response regulator MprA
MQRIAVIEDDAAIRFTLDTVLTEEGYEAILIEGPGDLLVQLTASKPDLVLLDLLLGAWGDGLALARAIRREPGWERSPIVVLSAARNELRQHTDELTESRCQVLEKPFDLDDLLAIIAGALASVQN